MPDLTPSATATSLSPQLSRLATVTMLRAAPARSIRAMTAAMVTLQVENAPTLTEAPASVDRAYAGTDGVSYFVPAAQVAKRSKITQTPNVFIARKEGKHYLRVTFELVRHASVPEGSTPLALTGITVWLRSSGQQIQLEAPQELLPAEEEVEIVKRVYCDQEVDANLVTSILQEDSTAWFDVTGSVSYRLMTTPPPSGPAPDVGRPLILHRALGRMRLGSMVADTAVAPAPTPAPEPAIAVARPLSGRLSLDLIRHIDLVRADLPVAPAPSAPQSVALPLTTGTRDGLHAVFPPSNAVNRPIYADVSSNFGVIDPSTPWLETTWGPFIESPIPDQFYFLPDEYRLAFDIDKGTPAMFVLLVPSANGAPPADGAPATISSEYRLRCRFGIAPWFDSERVDALRQEIASQTGIAYPDLVLGGVEKATFGLSKIYESLGSEVLGDSAEVPLEVDPRGFELVLDSTNEFYNLLSRMLVTEGLEGEVQCLLGAGEGLEPRPAVRPVKLRLDQPALNFLGTRFERPAEPEPEPEAEAAAAPPAEGGEEAAAPPDPPPPQPPPKVVVTNPSNVPVTVGSVRATLLVMDADMPTPIKAVPASATPGTLTLDVSADGRPTEIEVTLEPAEELTGVPWGGVAVSFSDVTATLDAEAMLAKAHELGASTDLKSSVVVRSYQLEHPDTLPESHKDVFGLEVQLKRGEAEPVTLFVTRDQPQSTVQVSFSLTDIMAGANPEQPKFSWRRRNMAGAGTGEWSEWETIVGQQLFVAPVGL